MSDQKLGEAGFSLRQNAVRGEIVKRVLILFFTLIMFIFSNEIQITYARFIEAEQVSHYLNMTEGYIRKTEIENWIGSLPLPDESSIKLQVTDKITFVAGDAGITETELSDYTTIIKEISLPTLKDKLKLLPVKKVTITLFTTSESYGQALLRAGIASSDVTAIVKSSGGITLNSSIWIPLYNLEGKGEITNALTHELTHVMLNQAGVASKLPLWLNEGTAWVTGLAAHEVADSFQAKVETVALRESIQNLAEKGELLPLDNTEQSLYYLEAQSFLATDALIKKYGLETFQEFLNQTRNNDVEYSFEQTFKLPLYEYEKSSKRE